MTNWVAHDWSKLEYIADHRHVPISEIEDAHAAECLSLDQILPFLQCPDSGQAIERLKDGQLLFGNGKNIVFTGARPVLLPEFARSLIKDNQFVFGADAYRLPYVQYMYLSYIKSKGGDQNSLYSDIWYQRHILRSQLLLSDASGCVLDVGCDTPSISSKMFPSQVKYIGLEPSLTASDEFCVCGMAESLPFKDCSLDGVVFNTSLDHIFDPHMAIDEAGRVLKPGGRLYISTLVWANNATLMTDTVHFHHFRDWQVQGMIKEFELKKIMRYNWKNNDHRYSIYLEAVKPNTNNI